MTRIDKYLWFVRLFKTRAKASEACGKGRVMVENTPVKASRAVVIGDTIQIKRPPVVYTFRVLDVPPTRIGAVITSERGDLDARPRENVATSKHSSGSSSSISSTKTTVGSCN